MPSGCRRDKTIGEIVQSYSLNCFDLNQTQGDIVRTFAKFYPNLNVTSPSWAHCQPLSTDLDCDPNFHHLGTNSIDFGTLNVLNRPDLLRAFLTFSAVWGGGLGIGLWKAGKYNAQIHLHVDGRMGDGQYRRWIEVGRSADGKILVSVVPTNEIIYQDMATLRVLRRVSKPGIWKATLADARSIYGYTGGPDADVLAQIKQTTDRADGSSSGVTGLFLGFVIGAAIGHATGNKGTMMLYGAAGGAAGWIAGKVGEALP